MTQGTDAAFRNRPGLMLEVYRAISEAGTRQFSEA